MADENKIGRFGEGGILRGKVDDAREYVEGKIEEYSPARAELTHSQAYHYPLELNSEADNKFPFMRFGFAGTSAVNKIAIYLYQPPGVSVSDSTNYTTMNVGTIRGGVQLATNFTQGNLTSGDMAALGLMSKDKLLTPGGTFEKLTSSTALKMGVATNPYTRTAYDSTNIRNFSFQFRLIAESEKEQKAIRGIERTFRKFLYPKRAGAIALAYPPLCNIQFFAEGGKRNEYMPNIKPSYLTTLEAVYNETASAVHKGTGAPIELSLTVSFQEERILTRDDLYRGENNAADDNQILESDGFAEGVDYTKTGSNTAINT